jgi:uncharacterized protein (DUF488 family)
MTDSVYTIGHSTHPVERLIELLALHGVTAVADVRSQPYSRFNPQFNREPLRVSLKAAGISYVFLGHELGARTDDRGCYVEGRVQYDLLARTRPFQAGLDRLAGGAGSHRIALLCAEKDPLVCHRGILICRHLARRGIGAEHILEDGGLESHEQALARLLAELGLGDGDLFRTREELIDEAYDRRGRQIAYAENEPAVETLRGEVQR